jgi:hypothetical protein
MTVPAALMSRNSEVGTDGRAIGSFEQPARVDTALLFVEKQATIQIAAVCVFQSILMIALRCHLFHQETGQIFQRKCRLGMRH